MSIGTITQFSHQAQGPPLMGMKERDALLPEDRWMTCPTFSVSTYFREARRHYERLVWIPTPSTKSWQITMRTGNEIWDELLDEDDADFVDDGDDDDDDDDDAMGEAEDDDDENNDKDATDDQIAEAYEALDIENDEVSVLIEEAGSDGTVFNDRHAARVLTRPTHHHPQDEDTSERTKLEKRRWSELMAIYLRNHWPRHDFDRETCTRELLEWGDIVENRMRAEVLAMMAARKKT
jgi:cobalamin biosynthesis protein CobT